MFLGVAQPQVKLAREPFLAPLEKGAMHG